MNSHQSWGRYPLAQHKLHPVFWRCDPLSLNNLSGSVLPFGLGRSYGDVCLNDGQWLIPTQWLRRFIAFDQETGILRCEAGVSLADILDFCVPKGWFLPVTPGTKFVTIGGAIANDVHGKNHHKTGTFGRHVIRFELLRSDGSRIVCSPEANVDLFSATIGGIGLTGLITWAEIRLIPISQRFIEAENIKFGNLEEFFELSAEFEKDYEYTVAWIDCLAKKGSLGRGIFICGNHVDPEAQDFSHKVKVRTRTLRVPCDFPAFALNAWSVKAFNFLYYNKQLRTRVAQTIDYNPFFYPLDAVLDWNRIYGKRGFLQYQCVVPCENLAAIRQILIKISEAKQGSFLAVLKVFGDVSSPGMLSFPRKGVTLALDFPIKGEKTFRLFKVLDAIVREAGGRLYPAKDACMSAEDFQTYYPNWKEFSRYVDPAFSSSFWRRVTPDIQKADP